MALRDEIPAYKPMSKLEEIIDALGAKEGKELVDLLEDPSISASGIARALHRRGYQITDWPIKNWRQKRGISYRRG